MTEGPLDASLEDVWRRESPHVLAALLRRHGDLADCEDAAQEALAAAAVQWPRDGVPDHPRGWLVTVASRRLVDQVRAERARAARETALAAREPEEHLRAPAADEQGVGEVDDSLRLLLLCCHPALPPASQVALTLRAVAGLSTAQVAAAFLVPEATMAQRLSRARATLRTAGARFVAVPPEELPARVSACLDVLHLVFTEGYAASAGPAVVDVSLTAEAVRLARGLRAALPDHDEAAGLLALMLLTSAREATRVDAAGDLVPLAEQDRSRWDAAMVAEGVALLEEVLPRGHVGRFQLEAAIAAVHAEAPSTEATDWRQVALLYAMLAERAPGPAVTLNRAVAVAEAYGAEQGLEVLEPLLADRTMSRHHRTYAVRAHLLERAGRLDEAREAYATAARMTASIPEQRYLNARLARLDPPNDAER
ncbi:RNA polymerase sigma factor, sigma-70 family [Microlunatus sagamiharensis]|uniref:RNA polymerase sigma factor, sigma-70 family n=1 Tax=Microlunatus sagamiharensis TaxID=546874 RepID=A0A1H2MYK2_9ACTN|nr:sigma-70 family RNA polymerase sigma factor [Microlunatus sagamiharensis]SDU98142.1 RNA polymerase sigma factor, sigma-70 family [Microlunatus sagamiharensis]